eukprot:g16795.t2
MRLRPVFILSEGFCRAHALPHKRILRPPLFKKAAEVVNYSKLAIRYTTSMTKDMVYGALREVFRRIGEAIASGAEVSVAFSFGVLEAKERKFRFVFDCAALCGSGAVTSRAETTSSCDGDFGAGEEWDGLSTSRSRSSSRLTSRRRPPSTAPRDYSNTRDDNDGVEFSNNQSPPATPGNEPPEADDRHRPTAAGDGEGEARGGGLLGKDFDKEVERQRAMEVAAEWRRKRGSGKRTKTREKVWEYAFRDHVTALEGQAEDDMILATRRKNLQLAEDRRKTEEARNKQREMHDLLTFVQGQIHEIEDRRAMEVESKRNGDRQLTFSARRDKASNAAEGYRGTAWRAPDWGPRRARANNLSREELLDSLQCQIREREEERARRNRRRLHEEKAALEKLDRHYDEVEERKSAQREEAQQELKRSWERHGHLKRLRALAKAGPAAVRNYALSHNIIDQGGKSNPQEGSRGGRAGWVEPGPRALTGPSKLYMKGLCRYRPCAVDDHPAGGEETRGGNGDGGARGCGPTGDRPRPRRPATSHSEASSVGFDSRLSARRV